MDVARYVVDVVAVFFVAAIFVAAMFAVQIADVAAAHRHRRRRRCLRHCFLLHLFGPLLPLLPNVKPMPMIACHMPPIVSHAPRCRYRRYVPIHRSLQVLIADERFYIYYVVY